MSINQPTNNSLKILLVLLITPLLLFKNGDSAKRKPNNIKHAHSKVTYTKMRTGMFANIHRYKQTKESNKDIFYFKATVNTNLSTASASYRWILPEGSTSIDGPLSGVITDFKHTDKLDVTISFENLEPNNKQIRLEVYSIEDGHKIGDIVSIDLNNSEEKSSINKKEGFHSSKVKSKMKNKNLRIMQ